MQIPLIFYTALYHVLIHPNILQDVNGQYPAMEGDEIRTVKEGNRYTVFSLWDTYRNVHQLLTLVYPNRQRDMIRSMIGMYEEHGWMPKWELFSRETYTMEGDPAIPVITDSWLKGLRGYDINKAYEAFRKSALTKGSENPLRPDNDEYMEKGYVALHEKFDNSVSHALEYYIADNALCTFGQARAAICHDDGQHRRIRLANVLPASAGCKLRHAVKLVRGHDSRKNITAA